MDIYSFLQILVGLAFFLFGMQVMSSSLEKMAGGSLETTMRKVTSNKWLSFLLGMLITCAIQSSSGVIVMLVGLVNSNIIMFKDTLPIILGTNVGTTITGWILTLTGIDSSSFSIMSVLSPKFFTPILAFAGVVMRMVSKKEKQKDLGTIFLGFAVLMYGMTFMSDSVKLMANEPWFAKLLLMFTNPILAVLISVIVTAVIQSSDATIGIIEAFASSGQISLGMAIPLVLGANIGTCVTGLISSIGVSKGAKRVSVLQVMVNCTGALIVLAVLLVIGNMEFLKGMTNHVGVALTHTLFNVFVTIVAFSIEPILIKIVKSIVRDEAEDLPKVLIDDRLLNQPSIAVTECMYKTIEMVLMARRNILSSLNLIKEFNEIEYETIKETEQMIDWYEDELDSFLVKLSKVSLSQADADTVGKMLHVITDYERIGDHANNLADLAKKLNESEEKFSEDAMKEVDNMINAINEIVEFATDCLVDNDLASGAQVEPLEEVIDYMSDAMMDSHVERLVKGKCSVSQGFLLSDFVNNCERVSDHCSNIAVAVIEASNDEFYTHQYLHDVKHESEDFKALYDFYFQKYC
ncbi:MAG: Na/Pi cotransporter family protein [Erysipelotrichaceae bacterium]|nr:Na/Pi cotransporter family protein [Erysipelotrichaceae bacterium]MBQ1300195.1 Na/Pi cotransporter family protein [Erysipelotrichaceae bacterium]MBQ1303478.1 Na/Pi cotransporter family protein [Erysipelotrichaceae bacterium]MBQ2214340.1 Na/Pi cotransporter family protein [Erysipelotrichaceae bacterium]MBQ2685381.1 Na/Pi cotransporter family protein [Erysipelotrichaceae bacterium]